MTAITNKRTCIENEHKKPSKWSCLGCGLLRNKEPDLSQTASSRIAHQTLYQKREDFDAHSEFYLQREVKFLGEGGTGTIIEVFDKTWDRSRALKIYKKIESRTFEQNVSHVSAMIFESIVMKSLHVQNTPHTPALYESFGFVSQDHTTISYSMILEKLGPDIFTIFMQQNRTMSFYQIVTFLKQSLEYLQDLHTLGERPIVHGDLSSGNMIFNERSNQLTIFDLGLAHRAPSKKFCYVRSFRPPEVEFRMEHNQTADFFALGSMAFWLFTGKRLLSLNMHNVPNHNKSELYYEYIVQLWERFGIFPAKEMVKQSEELASFFHLEEDKEGPLTELDFKGSLYERERRNWVDDIKEALKPYVSSVSSTDQEQFIAILEALLEINVSERARKYHALNLEIFDKFDLTFHLLCENKKDANRCFIKIYDPKTHENKDPIFQEDISVAAKKCCHLPKLEGPYTIILEDMEGHLVNRFENINLLNNQTLKITF